jgi:hypothetical protein
MASVAVGVIGIGLGTAFGLDAARKFADARDRCDPTRTLCSQEGVDEIHAAHTAATWSTVGFIGGGAALAGGVVLYVLQPRRQTSSDRDRSRGVAIGLYPSGGGGARTSVSLTF